MMRMLSLCCRTHKRMLLQIEICLCVVLIRDITHCKMRTAHIKTFMRKWNTGLLFATHKSTLKLQLEMLIEANGLDISHSIPIDGCNNGMHYHQWRQIPMTCHIHFPCLFLFYSICCEIKQTNFLPNNISDYDVKFNRRIRWKSPNDVQTSNNSLE